MYALLSVRAMACKRHGDQAHQAFLDIVNDMVRNGRFFTKKASEDPDWIAISLIGTIGDILVRADSAGVLDQYATTVANRYAAFVQRLDEEGGRISQDFRRLCIQYQSMHRIFVDAFAEDRSDAWKELTAVGGRHEGRKRVGRRTCRSPMSTAYAPHRRSLLFFKIQSVWKRSIWPSVAR